MSDGSPWFGVFDDVSSFSLSSFGSSLSELNSSPSDWVSGVFFYLIVTLSIVRLPPTRERLLC